MAESFVQWRGLTELIADMQTMSREARESIVEMTVRFAERVHYLYVRNLEGMEPSTASSPLPVGMRSGDLHEGATSEIVNQYSFTEWNDVPWAGWIEDGTAKMEPRAPLADAIRQFEEEMETALDEVLVGILGV
jgi:hypothetical protein